MPVILLVQMFAGDETKDDTDFFFCTTSCALCCPPMSPLFVQVSYRHVTADLRQWYKPTLCLHSRHGTMTRLLSHMWSDRGVEKARTFVFSTAAECHFGRAITASLMCVSASLISTPPLCFSYTTSRSHKGMRGRNKREESKQASDGAEREREEWRSRTKMWRWRGNEVEYKDVELPNRAGAAERMCFVCCAECMHVCVRLKLYSVYVCWCMRAADSALAGSAAHHTPQPTADYTALVLSSLYSVLRPLSAREPAQN